jgi:S1-C subfamily serine protease
MAIYESLLARQSRESPWIGVSVLRMSREQRRAAGAPDSVGIQIDNVFTPSPAATLGLRAGDVIAHMQGEDVRTVYDFQRILYAAGVGQEITLEVVRKGARSEHTVRIEKRPPEATTR